MGKYVCDVCGTTYPDTAEQCPICGSANRSRAQTRSGGDGKETVAASYTTRGGRYSKSNVRKRTQAAAAAQPKRSEQPRYSEKPKRSEQPAEEEQNNAGLVAVVVLLLLAIIAVLIYIGVRYFSQSEVPDDTGGSSIVETTDPTDDPTEDPNRVACESVMLSNPSIKLSAEKATFQLVVQRLPENTTDDLIFISSDETVATVTDSGLVTAVGGGNAIITVKCGDQSATCVVSCPFGEASTDPTETEFVWNFEWNTVYQLLGKADVSLFYVGETWTAYNSDMNVPVSEVTWHSDNENVCTFKNGIITAIGPGDAYIYAEYDGVRYTGIVRCKFTIPSVDPTDPTEDPTDPTEDPTEDPTDPSEDPTDPSEDNTDPSVDPTDPSEDNTDPSEDTTDPSEDTTDPTEDNTDPSEDTTDPVEDTDAPTQDGGETGGEA